MSNIYYWQKLTFSKLEGILEEYLTEHLKEFSKFEEQKGIRSIRGNVYIGIIVFIYLSRTKHCLRFPLSCFIREIKGFYQSSFGNEVDFRGIMNVSLNVLAKNSNFKNLWHRFEDGRAMIKATLMSSCHWKTLIPFYLWKKRPENALITLTMNYRKFVQKNKLRLQNNIELAFNDM